jgi:predicted  nucleic acid-binding Zn-ribbon protein
MQKLNNLKDTLVMLENTLLNLVKNKTDELNNIQNEFSNLLSIAEKMDLEKTIIEQTDKIKDSRDDLQNQLNKNVDVLREYL